MTSIGKMNKEELVSFIDKQVEYIRKRKKEKHEIDKDLYRSDIAKRSCETAICTASKLHNNAIEKLDTLNEHPIEMTIQDIEHKLSINNLKIIREY